MSFWKPLAVCLPVLIIAVGCSRTPEQKHARFMKAAAELMESHDYARAILNYQSAIQIKPEDADARYRLGLAFLAFGRPKDAVVAFRLAIEANPQHPAAQLKLAELAILTHNEQIVKDAESRVQKILSENPSDDDALYMLAATQLELGKPEDAEKHLQELLERSPQHLKSAITLAQMKLAGKDLRGAEEILTTAFTKNPASPDAAVALGILYLRTGKKADAEQALQKAVTLDPNNPGALNTLAALQLQAGKKVEAEQTYKQIAALPQKEYKLSYAVFLMRQKRREEAVAELERLFKSDPGNRTTRSGLVAGYLATNQEAKAESVLGEALKRNVSDLEALLQRSQIYLRQKKYDEAQRDVEALLRMEPASSQVHYLMAQVHKGRGATLHQRNELNEALRLAPESFRVRMDLANLLLTSHNPKEAMNVLNGVEERQKRSVAYVSARNWVLIALGDQNEARKGVDAVLAVSKQPDILLQDAVLRLASRDFGGARAALEQALKATPEDVRMLSLLTESYMMQKQPAAAAERIRRHASQHSGSAQIQMFWANWLLENGRKAEARQPLTAAKAANPSSAAPDIILARLDLEDGNRNGARQRLEAVINSNQRSAAHMMLASLEETEGNNQKAIEHYRRVVEADNSNSMALNNLAFALSRDTAMLDEAMKYAQKAKELAPENAYVQDTLGWIYYRKGLYQMAARELERALVKDNLPIIRLHLGMAYRKLGEVDKGRQLMTAALAADPKLAGSEIEP
jgi:putative PEP-CTERM system TPR-repeat lipoprotein